MDSYTGNNTNTNQSDLKSTLKDDAKASKDQISQSMRSAGQEAKKDADKKLSGAKDTAASTMDDLSRVAESAAKTLQEEHHENLSHYVSDIAQYVSSVANSLRSKNTDELINDAKRMARDNPALFIAGSVAIGLGIARLAKSGTSSSKQSDSQNTYNTGTRSDFGRENSYGSTSSDPLLSQSYTSNSSQDSRTDLDKPSKSYTTSESLVDRY